MKDHAIIYNPTSAAGKSKEHINLACNYLDKFQVNYKLFESEFAGHTIELARQCAKDSYIVIGAGGDGTCNEVLHGVITSNSGALCGFIPMGSGNDIPGAVGIKPDIKRACEIIAEGKSGKCDVGFAKTDENVERYFLGIGSQGFDAEVTRKTNEGEKKFSGTWNYLINVLKTIFPWKNKKVRVIMDDDIYEGFSNCVAVGNGPSYGGWMYICQTANLHDGKFHVSIVDIGKFKMLYDFRKLYDASLMPYPYVHEYTSKKVRFEMVDPEDDDPYICQVDGEILGLVPVEYKCIQDGYEFIKPEIDEVAEAFKEKHGRYFYEYCKEKK